MVRRLAVLLVLLLSQLTTAQEAPAAEAKADNPGKAIRFEFNGLNLHGVDGGIGGKWWASPHAAITASLRFANSTHSEDPIEGEYQAAYEEDGSSMGVTLGLEQHLRMARRLSPYVGFFLQSGFEWRKTTVQYPFADDPRRREISRDMFHVGAGMSVGVEYFLADNISVAGEHCFRFLRSSGEEERSEPGMARESDVSSWSVGFTTSGLILSVYF